MSDMLYIQTDKNMKVLSEQVQLQDIAQLTSNNPAVLNRCKVLRVITLPKGKYGRYTVSAIELVDLGIYQVRGYDMTNITFVRGDTGWIVFDPLMSCECSRAAFQLVTDNLGERPVMGIVMSHPFPQ